MNTTHLFEVAAQIAVLLFAVSFHESAHGLVALKCGDRTALEAGRISLNPLRHLDPIGSLFVPLFLAAMNLPIFGWARPVPVSLVGVPNPRRANLLISAAGPLSNVLLALASALGFFVLRPFLGGNARESAVGWLLIAAAGSVIVNVSLAVFNLFPIPPLDGFGVLQSLLPARLFPLVIWLRRFGFIILLVVMYTGLLNPVFRLALDPVYRWLR